jgi:3-hydroxyacyl-CoA dehydrogenase
VLERADVKSAVISDLDAAIGLDTLVGSSFSGLAASLFTGHVGCRARCLIAHPVIEMTREAEGFILNRLQGVLPMEAWRLAEAGLATAEDVDKTVSQGLGLRWAFMGPFETIDLNAPGGWDRRLCKPAWRPVPEHRRFYGDPCSMAC